jgi:hypothetical protein
MCYQACVFIQIKCKVIYILNLTQYSLPREKTNLGAVLTLLSTISFIILSGSIIISYNTRSNNYTIEYSSDSPALGLLFIQGLLNNNKKSNNQNRNEFLEPVLFFFKTNFQAKYHFWRLSLSHGNVFSAFLRIAVMRV